MKGLVVLEKLHVGTTTFQASLELGLILDNQGVILVVNGLWELGGDGVVGSLVLEHKTLVAVNATEDTWLLDGPLSNVCPILLSALLLRLRSLPSRLPVVCELLEEWGLESGGLFR